MARSRRDDATTCHQNFFEMRWKLQWDAIYIPGQKPGFTASICCRPCRVKEADSSIALQRGVVLHQKELACRVRTFGVVYFLRTACFNSSGTFWRPPGFHGARAHIYKLAWAPSVHESRSLSSCSFVCVFYTAGSARFAT
jgi:hypothetical protein